MRLEKQLLAVSALTALVLSLGACGGGGGSTADGAQSAASGGATSGTGSSTNDDGAPQANAAQFAGTFVSPCAVNDEVSTDSGKVRQVVTISLDQTADDKLVFTRTETYFDPTDIACTGTSIGETSRTGDDSVWQLDGNKDATFNSTIVSATRIMVSSGTVDQITVGGITITGGSSISAPTLVFNGITFPGDYFDGSTERPELAYVDSTGTLHLGEAQAGSDGYPDALDDSSGLSRQ